MDADFDRVFAKSDALSNFVQVQVFEEAQANHDGLIFRQRFDGLENEVLRFEKIHIRIVDRFQSNSRFDRLVPFAFFAPKFFKTGVSGDCREPANYGVRLFQFGYGLQRLHDRILDQIFGSRTVVHKAVGDGIEDSVMGPDNLSHPIPNGGRGDTVPSSPGVEPFLDGFGNLESLF